MTAPAIQLTYLLFWHRGLGTTDIALGQAMLAKAARLGLGQRLRYA